MRTEVTKTEWAYNIFVSKDSPKNPHRGDFDRLPDNEYYRGYYPGGCYTTLKEAQKALAYYEKGHIYKYRHVHERGYGVNRYGREEKIIQTA